MVDKSILRLTPKSIFCPICQRNYEWDGQSLQEHDAENPHVHWCKEIHDIIITIWFDDEGIYLRSGPICRYVGNIIDDTISFENIENPFVDGESVQPKLDFTIYLHSENKICSMLCYKRFHCADCHLPYFGDDQEEEYVLELPFSICFEEADIKAYLQELKKKSKRKTQTPIDKQRIY